MLIYIQIPIAPNNPIFTPEDYAVDYLETTGEGWVQLNMEEEAGVRMMMGTTRATEAHCIELKSRWPMMTYKVTDNHELPAGWIPKTIEVG